MGLSLNRPAPTKGIAVFPKKNTLRASSSIMASEARSEGTREQAASRAEERDSFLSPPLAVASPLAWLLATPPIWTACSQARKSDKGSANSRRGWVAIMIYPVELWNPYYFRRFPTTFRKCRNVRRSVFRRRLSTSEATLGDSLVKEPQIHFRYKLLH